MIVYGNNNQVNIGGQTIVNNQTPDSLSNFSGSVTITTMDGQTIINGHTEPTHVWYQIGKSTPFKKFDTLPDVADYIAAQGCDLRSELSGVSVYKYEQFGQAIRHTFSCVCRDLMIPAHVELIDPFPINKVFVVRKRDLSGCSISYGCEACKKRVRVPIPAGVFSWFGDDDDTESLAKYLSIAGASWYRSCTCVYLTCSEKCTNQICNVYPLDYYITVSHDSPLGERMLFTPMKEFERPPHILNFRHHSVEGLVASIEQPSKRDLVSMVAKMRVTYDERGREIAMCQWTGKRVRDYLS